MNRVRNAVAASLAGAWVWAAPAAAQTGVESACHALGAALEASAQAWSRGDVDGFMRIYEASPDTVYVGTSGLTRGYEAIRSMYGARFTGPAPDAGALSLEVLDCRTMGADFALVTGAYELRGLKSAPGQAHGLFTLVFHRGAAGWRVISDHSS